MGAVETRTEELRILLADGQALFREAVRVVLDSQPEFTVVEEAADGVLAVACAERVRPHVALIDADLPKRNGLATAALIGRRVPGCRVLILSAEEDVTTLIEALRSGASGYVAKASPLADLIAATRAVHRGETVVPSHMIGELVSRLLRVRAEQDDALQRIARLTSREREVLALLADRGNNDMIAGALAISPQTARTHVQNILGKLGVHSRLAAAALVINGGLRQELERSNGEGRGGTKGKSSRTMQDGHGRPSQDSVAAGLGEGWTPTGS
jgi:DNA-binding NarL/FixJ family response regulator